MGDERVGVLVSQVRGGGRAWGGAGGSFGPDPRSSPSRQPPPKPSGTRFTPTPQTNAPQPMGTLLVNERMLETYVYARDKFLKPGGKMFPQVRCSPRRVPGHRGSAVRCSCAARLPCRLLIVLVSSPHGSYTSGVVLEQNTITELCPFVLPRPRRSAAFMRRRSRTRCFTGRWRKRRRSGSSRGFTASTSRRCSRRRQRATSRRWV